ncbi:MAG: heme-binding protein [Planctomycetaceae bacterium]|nr:heme-binding protein [Planctomycetaceae bacterium]
MDVRTLFVNWFRPSDHAPRPWDARDETRLAEQLEPRLVLGSLLPGPPTNAGAPVTPAPQNDAQPVDIDIQTPSQHDRGLTIQIDRPNAQEGVVSIEVDVETGRPSDGNDIEGTVLPNPLEDPVEDDPIDGIILPTRSDDASPQVADVEILSLSATHRTDSGNEDAQIDDQRDAPLPLEQPLTNGSEGIFVPTVPANVDAPESAPQARWFEQGDGPHVVRYDFRDQNGISNQLTAEQRAIVEESLELWADASSDQIQFVRDQSSEDGLIVNIGLGDLAAIGLSSGEGGTVAASGSAFVEVNGGSQLIGTIWLDSSEVWENTIENGDVDGSIDLFTVVSHETGHVIGLRDVRTTDDSVLMNPVYSVERTRDSIAEAFESGTFVTIDGSIDDSDLVGHSLYNMMVGYPQLSQVEVNTLLERASAFSDREDAIIAIVDRNGTILGVRAEQDVLDNFAGDDAGLAFAVDGAVSKARTAAFFANDTAPLTSRLVRFISQSTVTEREVDSNPNITDPNSTVRGPGFIAPIGLGGHFPPDIPHTPPVDLFAIEHTNRDSLVSPGPDRIQGTPDDIALPYRFNINPANVPAGQEIVAPLSYGDDAGIDGVFQNRGIATLPGGVPIYRDTNADGRGDTLIGGIGVFFPGPDGYATFEQNFIPNSGQTSIDRVNAPLVLEAELTAVAALGGSEGAVTAGAPGAEVGAIAGIEAIDDIDIPFGNLTLVGINLEVIGPCGGIEGVRQLLDFGEDNITPGAVSGSNQILGGGDLLRDGASVPDGHLVTPQSSATDNLTAADVTQIIDAAIAAANETRAAVRLDADASPGARTRMVFAITDTTGEVLGLYRMEDATVFSIDVAVAKARNVAYYADPDALQPEDQIDGVDAGVAFTNRTFRFVAEPRFPDGVDGTDPPPFSILLDAEEAGIDPRTGENIGAPAPASVFDSVLGYDSFNPGTNFRDPDDLANQNGVVFFPGSTPLYKDGVLVGGFGVSGDGVDQDDVVTFLGAMGFLPDGVATTRADQVRVDGVRLPYQKFLRNPFG